MEEEGCKQQVGLLHALFINIQMTKILAKSERLSYFVETQCHAVMEREGGHSAL